MKFSVSIFIIHNKSIFKFQATNFNQPLNNWDVSKVTDMHEMFVYAYQRGHIYSFNMFMYCLYNLWLPTPPPIIPQPLSTAVTKFN